jgi:hypothetical protein
MCSKTLSGGWLRGPPSPSFPREQQEVVHAEAPEPSVLYPASVDETGEHGPGGKATRTGVRGAPGCEDGDFHRGRRGGVSLERDAQVLEAHAHMTSLPANRMPMVSEYLRHPGSFGCGTRRGQNFGHAEVDQGGHGPARRLETPGQEKLDNQRHSFWRMMGTTGAEVGSLPKLWPIARLPLSQNGRR